MIDKQLLKRYISLGLLLISAVAILGTINLLASIQSKASSGADVNSAFNEVPEVPQGADHLITWLADQWQGERQIEPATRKQIEAAYVRAWASLSRYASTNNSDGINTWFSGPAKRTALAFPNKQSPSRITSLGHKLELRFYSLDGATLAIRDASAHLMQNFADSNDVIITKEQYDLVFVLEDGYWRINQMRKASQDETTVVYTKEESAMGVHTSLTKPLMVQSFQCTEYQPSNITLADQWPNFDEKQVLQELSDIKANGNSCVQVAIGNEFLTDDNQAKIKQLKAFLDVANQAQITIVPILFDDKFVVSAEQWPQQLRIVTLLASELKGHPALHGWQIATEFKLSTNKRTLNIQAAWLIEITTAIHNIDPQTPVAINWTSTNIKMQELINWFGLVANTATPKQT